MTSLLTSAMYDELTPIVRDRISEKCAPPPLLVFVPSPSPVTAPSLPFIQLVQDFLSSYPSPPLTQETKKEKSSSAVTVASTSDISPPSSGKRAREEASSSTCDLVLPPEALAQEPFSLSGNGFVVSEVQSSIALPPFPHCFQLKKFLPLATEEDPKPKTTSQSSTIRLNHQSGQKYDFVFSPSSDDPSQEPSLLSLLDKVVRQVWCLSSLI
jgi:hypothetical protein